MFIVQVRLSNKKIEGTMGGYYNYEFGLSTTEKTFCVNFATERLYYSVEDGEVKTITRIDE
jgi:hypothetical protein